MKTLSPVDTNYLRLQFSNKVLKASGAEFQSFFENVMSSAFPEFQKIRPYGRKGDGGNDGYIPSEGRYFQAYAPLNPQEKEADAAKKIKNDFEKVKKNWDKISTVKKYNFVFNDKEMGVGIEIEKALAELGKANPTITFQKFTPKDLGNIFFTLQSDQIVALGFDVDSRNTLKVIRGLLNELEVDLDRDNVAFVEKSLSNIKSAVSDLNNNDLILEFDILEARTLQKQEKVDEARCKYENLAKRYPRDPRPVLYQAEIYLNEDNLQKNDELLRQAEAIDKNHWLLKLEKLVRACATDEKVDLSEIDENDFPHDKKLKSNFYRIYSLLYGTDGDYEKADSFIEKAIRLYPDKFSNYSAKLSLLEDRLFSPGERNNQKELAEKFLSEIDSVEQIAKKWGELGTRSKAVSYARKLKAFQILENPPLIVQNAKDCFECLMQCYFDRPIDAIFVGILTHIILPNDDQKRLLSYLYAAKKTISDNLTKLLVVQFINQNTLYSEGKDFFQKIGNKTIHDFIWDLENKEYAKILEFLEDDHSFAVAIANTAKDHPELRFRIIENLPDDGNIQKDKLFLLLNNDEGATDKAFDILRKLDLSNLGYFESRYVLDVARKKEAWDFISILLENLISLEKDKKSLLDLKLQLFTARFNLKQYREAAKIGEQILSCKEELDLINDENKESLLVQTLLAMVRRDELPQALRLMETHIGLLKTSESILSIKVGLYLKNKIPEKALSSIVEGMKLIQNPTPEQYAGLFLYFTEIGNMMDFPLSSLEEVINGCFVKIKGQERWYFIGDDNELDATKIAQSNQLFNFFIKKKLGDKIQIKEKYRADNHEMDIENILPIEKYICWQCQHNTQELAKKNILDGIKIIDVPTTADGTDFTYIKAFLEDDKNPREKFFELYAKQPLPLAFLAANEGGLTGAIGHIINEQKGYVHFSPGSIEEINQQKEIAQKILDGEKFYLDGTSALILGETGLLEDIHPYLSGLMIPQSVITFLFDISDKFRYAPGQIGHMGYAQGRIVFSEIDPETREKVRDNFKKATDILESKPQNIQVISQANKTDTFSETRIEPALCDACILAQRDGHSVLTEDHIYLKVNELDTKKTAPLYCSSFALIRILYEQGKIGFQKYLEFFHYLAGYRFRFLPITVEDIEKSVFGEKDVKVFRPENIKLWNFPLTLSEEYGVPFGMAVTVIGKFLIKMLIDDSVVREMMDKIFIEIMETFPTKDKGQFGQLLLSVTVTTINKVQQKIILGRSTQEKFDSLSQLAEIYKSKSIILP